MVWDEESAKAREAFEEIAGQYLTNERNAVSAVVEDLMAVMRLVSDCVAVV